MGESAMKARLAAILLLAGFLSASPVRAEDSYTVSVVDLDGRPVSGAVVYIETKMPRTVRTQTTTIIDQVDKQFSPRISVVQVGATVDFPNSDAVSHHVYSFANPNNFELPLYKGETRPSVRFEHPGLVVLGCNIHDSMLGYILVVDTPYFAVTDEQGEALLNGIDELVDGNPLRVWAPELDNGQLLEAFRKSGPTSGTQTAAANGVLRFMVNAYSEPPAAAAGDALSWDDY